MIEGRRVKFFGIEHATGKSVVKGHGTLLQFLPANSLSGIIVIIELDDQTVTTCDIDSIQFVNNYEDDESINKIKEREKPTRRTTYPNLI